MPKLEQLAGATVDERTLRVLCSYPAWRTPTIRHPWAISIRRAKAWSRSGFFADFSITCGLYVKTPARIKRSTVCAMRFPTVRRRRGNGPGPLHADGPDGHRETHGFFAFCPAPLRRARQKAGHTCAPLPNAHGAKSAGIRKARSAYSGRPQPEQAERGRAGIGEPLGHAIYYHDFGPLL